MKIIRMKDASQDSSAASEEDHHHATVVEVRKARP